MPLRPGKRVFVYDAYSPMSLVVSPTKPAVAAAAAGFVDPAARRLPVPTLTGVLPATVTAAHLAARG